MAGLRSVSRLLRLAPPTALALWLLTVAVAETPARGIVPADNDGQWTTLPYLMPINPIHAGLLRTGRVLVIAGSENDSTKTTYRAAVWDPVTDTIAVQAVPWDLYCNGMSALPDGRIFITGGNLKYPSGPGIRTTTIFDPVTERFIQVQDMARGRWYPTNTALADGRTTTFSGKDETNVINQTVEIYDVPSGWSPELPAPWTPPTYPFLHLLPDGRVFYSGMTPISRFFDPAPAYGSSGGWSGEVARFNYPRDRWAGSSVLLPLSPATAYAPRVMIMGGDNPATATAEVIDLAQPAPTWRWLPPMSRARIEMNAVLLPTGRVLALGGSARRNDATTASLAADLFDPVTETWSSAGEAAYPRMFHSVTLLLPDATVWVAGSNPRAGTWEPRMEIYRPPYLFARDANGDVVPASRPTIVAAPETIGYNETFRVRTPNAADIASVALIRPGANTHAIDMEQRMVQLGFRRGGRGRLIVTAPPLPEIAPPGYYMLFLVNRAGVPSTAAFVQLARHPMNQRPTGTIAAPAGDVTITAGSSVTFAGSAMDPDGVPAVYSWVFPGGTPAGSSQANPGVVRFATAGTYAVSLTVTDDLGDNDPSPSTRVITVVAPPPGG